MGPVSGVRVCPRCGILRHLKHIRELITQAGRYDTTCTRLLCFSGAGFNDKAQAAAEGSPRIQLVDLVGLYGQV
ncbi:hypothetical protein [Streptomyces milbemycinicus]|uniref:hypothetical protein n=1 Tax=Streptomyces milbemycinicus TaxID=476552 RepID=UPI0033CAE338